MRDEYKRAGGGGFAVYLLRNTFAFSDVKSSRIRNIMDRAGRLCSITQALTKSGPVPLIATAPL